MLTFSWKQLRQASVDVHDAARQAPVEIMCCGRVQLVVLSVEDYALLRSNRRISFLRQDLPLATIERIATSRMSPEHTYLDTLMDD